MTKLFVRFWRWLTKCRHKTHTVEWCRKTAPNIWWVLKECSSHDEAIAIMNEHIIDEEGRNGDGYGFRVRCGLESLGWW